jgi:hypothetical protein
MALDRSKYMGRMSQMSRLFITNCAHCWIEYCISPKNVSFPSATISDYGLNTDKGGQFITAADFI